MPRLRPRRPGIGGGARGQRLAAGAAAYVSPNISGEQPEGVTPGAYNSGSTMEQIKRNEYLNTLSLPDRERYMAQTGYFNNGVPQAIPKTSRAEIRAYAQQPGHTAAGTYMMPDRSGTFEIGAEGFVPGSATPFRPAGGGGGRDPHAGMPHTQIGQQGKGTGIRKAGPLPGQPGGLGGRPGGFPQQTGGGGGGGRPGNPSGGGGGRPGGRPNRPGGGNGGGGPAGGGAPGLGGFPKMPPTPPAFLPMTPGFESAYRTASDALAGAEGAYAVGKSMIPAQLDLQRTRLDTDRDLATDRLKEELAARGVYTGGASPAGGGIGETLYNRRVATPFGRAYQDLAASGAGQYADLTESYGGAQLGYNQQILEALLGRAGEAYEAMPLNLPIGGYDLPGLGGPMFSTEAGGGRTRPRRGDGRRGDGRNRPRGRK